MFNKKVNHTSVETPFIIGGDGRLYIRGKTVEQSTITKGKLTCPVRQTS